MNQAIQELLKNGSYRVTFSSYYTENNIATSKLDVILDSDIWCDESELLDLFEGLNDEHSFHFAKIGDKACADYERKNGRLVHFEITEKVGEHLKNYFSNPNEFLENLIKEYDIPLTI
ncbi:hypothetical protein HZA97_03635 [Candidatus Woesearchaeota archaeon]|nr:hypothetical protein [Candidatus Woesearchaeota archaeon]